MDTSGLTSAAVKAPPNTGTTLSGGWLWFGRLLWLLATVLALLTLSEIWPENYNFTYGEWVVSNTRTAVATVMKYGDFVHLVTWLESLSAATSLLMGFLIIRYRSNDKMGLFVSAFLILISPWFISSNMDVWHLPGWVPLGNMLVRLEAMAALGCLILFFYLFPDGRFVPRWTRWAMTIPIFALGLFFLGQIYPIAVPTTVGDFIWLIFAIPMAISLVIGAFSQLYRYRHTADRVQRQQMKWVVFAATLFISTLVFALFGLAGGPFDWGPVLELLFGMLTRWFIPLAIGFSILRYRLWDIDLIINRTLVFTGLTLLVAAVYILTVGLMGHLFQTDGSILISALAIILIALVILPLYRRIKSWVDHLLPVSQQQEQGNSEAFVTTVAPPSWPMRLAQGVWLLLLVYTLGQLVTTIFNFDLHTRQILQGWLVQESTKDLPLRTVEDLGRLIVANRIWTLAISSGTAVLVFWRKRHEWMALYAAFLLLLANFAITPGNDNPTFIAETLSIIGIGVIIFFPFIFPTGQFVPRSWRWRGILAGIIVLIPLVFFTIIRIAFPEKPQGELDYFNFILTLTAVFLAGITSQIYRYRKLSTPLQRRQTRWVLTALAAQIIWFAWAVVWLITDGNAFLPESLMAMITLIGLLVTSTLLPLSITIAILYDRLWQIDVVLNRTLVFGSLTILIVLFYVLVVGILGTLFQSGNNLLLSVLATGLIAVLFDPLRRRLQKRVNQFMYGQRDDPLAVMAALGKHLENTAVPNQTLPVLVQTIAQALKLPYVAIINNENVTLAAAGENQMTSYRSFPLVYHSQTIGQLQIAPREAGEKFSPEEEKLLDNVARQAGTAVYAAQLTDQLQQSRERLVITREEERRRLRRDLHDGLGPQLATLTIKAGAAQNLLRSNPDEAEKLLHEIKAESQIAIKEIRQVVDGLRPSTVDQLGLGSALQEFVSQNSNGNVQITLKLPNQLPILPAAVEVAAYRIITEAVTNVLRHAQAKSCLIEITVNGRLTIEIQDDGCGLPVNYRQGVGLSSMRERTEELGGLFEIKSNNQGSIVSAVLPIN